MPLVRRDAGPEQDALHKIINDFDAGRTGGQRLIREVRQLANRRHESLGDSGKFEIDRAVANAADALSKMDRKALYPAEAKTTPAAGQTPPTPAADRPKNGRPRRDQPADTGAVAAALGKATSRAEAGRHLDGLSVAQLHQVGEQAGITTYRSDPKSRLRESLIEGLTGRRLDSDAILNHARRTEPGTPSEDGPGFTRAYPDA